MALKVLLLAWLFVFACFPTAALAQKRVALVIGNDSYRHAGLLYNAGRDAQEIGTLLQSFGFELVGGGPLTNLDKSQMDWAVTRFGQMAQGADVALFYFSGHGMQIGGTNYLSPVDAGPVSAGTVDLQNLNSALVLRALEHSNTRLKIVLLDACRSNPLLPGRSAQGGLAHMMAPAGTIIGFATQPGALASDGPKGRNSPYATALSAYLRVQGLELFALLNEVGLAVMAQTKGAQQPWISASPISGRFYFRPPLVSSPIPPTPQVFGYAPPVPTQVESTGAALSYIQAAQKQLGNRDYAGARETLSEGIRHDAQSAPAHSYRGFAWYLDGVTRSDPETSLHMYRTGFPDLDKAIRFDPAYAIARRHRGNTIMATYRALIRLKRPVNTILDNAIDDLRQSVRLEPDGRFNLQFLGMAYLVGGRYGDAIAEFNKATALFPNYVAPYSGRCMAYRMLKDMQSARLLADWAASRYSRLKQRPCLTLNLLDFWSFSATNL